MEASRDEFDSSMYNTQTQYKIKTKKLSYGISPQVDKLSCVCWGEKPSRRNILKNVDCEARPGEIMAIAGPSGAGKTTLLEILARAIPLSRVSDHVLVNELPMNAKRSELFLAMSLRTRSYSHFSLQKKLSSIVLA